MLMNIDIYTNHIREIIHESIRKLEPHVQFETGGASRHCQPSIYNNKHRKLRLFLLPIDPSHVRGRQPGWSPATCGTLAHMASGKMKQLYHLEVYTGCLPCSQESSFAFHLPAGRLRSYSLFFSHYQTRLAGQFYISHVNPCHTVGRK